MNIGITGSDGFIGWHLRALLYVLKPSQTIKLGTRDTFESEAKLSKFINNLDVIIHLAGINRGSDEEVYFGNLEITKKLVNSLKNTKSKCRVIFASSTYCEKYPSAAFSKAKNESIVILEKNQKTNPYTFTSIVIPNVFGEFCRPNYNSVVATFCDQIINKEELNVDFGADVELIHVQEVAREIIDLIDSNKLISSKRLYGQQIKVAEIADILKRMYSLYILESSIPNLSNDLELNLFNTLKSHIPLNSLIKYAKINSDERGFLVETSKSLSGGQSFFSVTESGITRGNHFHLRKFERFSIVEGEAEITIRKIFDDKTIKFKVHSKDAPFIDIPNFFTHNIKNIGKGRLITLFWANEIFDSKKPDTFFEEV